MRVSQKDSIRPKQGRKVDVRLFDILHLVSTGGVQIGVMMNFQLPHIQAIELFSEGAIQSDQKLVEFLQRAAALIDADSVQLVCRARHAAASTVFAAWSNTQAAPQAVVGDPCATLDCAWSEGAGTAVIPLEIDRSRSWTLVFRRSGERPAFSQAEIAVAHRGGEFFLSAFKTWRLHQSKMRRLAGMESFASKIEAGVVLLSAHGRIVFANRRAEEIIARGDGLTRAAGRISAKGFTNSVRLQALLQCAFQASPVHDAIEASSVIALERAGAPPLALAAFPLETRGRRLLVGLYILDPVTDIAPAVEIACRAQGLTPTEVRLAAHLVAGTSLNDACERMRIRRQTGRTYLNQIFSKLGICRQVDLVRLLLNTAVRLRLAPRDLSVRRGRSEASSDALKMGISM